MSFALVLSSPHAGEFVPEEAFWLQGLPETLLMADVDRYVTELYSPISAAENIPFITADCHRYVIDLNRLPQHVDPLSVEGFEDASFPSHFASGIHWVKTTQGKVLMKKPISQSLHKDLLNQYYVPFHDELTQQLDKAKQNTGIVFHLDLHSMPSRGTSAHQDDGELRKEVVISDLKGKSASPQFVECVKSAFVSEGFEVGYNWPYIGGGITQRYGQPQEGQHTVQVELRRNKYMDEVSKQKNKEFSQIQESLGKVIKRISHQLHEPSFKKGF